MKQITRKHGRDTLSAAIAFALFAVAAVPGAEVEGHDLLGGGRSVAAGGGAGHGNRGSGGGGGHLGGDRGGERSGGFGGDRGADRGPRR